MNINRRVQKGIATNIAGFFGREAPKQISDPSPEPVPQTTVPQTTVTGKPSTGFPHGVDYTDLPGEPTFRRYPPLPLVSPVRGPEPRADGMHHAEEALLLPEGHAHQDIDEFPPKGFPPTLEHINGSTPNSLLGGINFMRDRHKAKGTEGVFDSFKPGIRSDASGKKFISKIVLPDAGLGAPADKSRRNTLKEAMTDRLYRIFGVPVPRSQVYSLQTGNPVPTDYQWSAGEGATRVAEHLGDASHTVDTGPEAKNREIFGDPVKQTASVNASWSPWRMHKARHIITEALFDGGHDNHFGNTMYDGKHYDIPWRIDNGDALQTDAQGAEKDSWRRSAKTQTVLPGIYHAIRHGDVSAKEAFSQMQAIAQIWRRQKGAIEKLYACQEDPEQFKIFQQRVHSILTTLDICRSPLQLQKQIRSITRNLEELKNATDRQLWTEADRLKEPYDFKESKTSGIMRRSFGGEMMTKPLVFRKARRRDALVRLARMGTAIGGAIAGPDPSTPYTVDQIAERIENSKPPDLARVKQDAEDFLTPKAPLSNSLVFRTGLEKAYKTPAWQRAEGQSPKGGLNAKGRASAKANKLSKAEEPPQEDKEKIVWLDNDDQIENPQKQMLLERLTQYHANAARPFEMLSSHMYGNHVYDLGDPEQTKETNYQHYAEALRAHIKHKTTIEDKMNDQEVQEALDKPIGQFAMTQWLPANVPAHMMGKKVATHVLGKDHPDIRKVGHAARNAGFAYMSDLEEQGETFSPEKHLAPLHQTMLNACKEGAPNMMTGKPVVYSEPPKPGILGALKQKAPDISKSYKSNKKNFSEYDDVPLHKIYDQISKAYKTPAWQRAEGQNPKGGLNAKGRASAKAEGHNLKPPVKSGDNPRRASFLARMGNSPGPEYDEHGKPTRLLLSLQAWGASSKADARKKAKAISARLHASE